MGPPIRHCLLPSITLEKKSGGRLLRDTDHVVDELLVQDWE